MYPRTGGTIFVKSGRFGPYLYVEPCKDSKYKPKTLSIPSKYSKQLMTLETAVELLTPLHEVGFHPDDGDVVEIRRGRFNNRYVRHGRTAAKLPKDIDPCSVTMDLAMEYLRTAEQEDRKKRSKVKKKKEKTKMNKPKGRNAYILYSSSRRKELQGQKVKMLQSVLMKTLASEWKALSDSEKAPYVKLAQEEKARFVTIVVTIDFPLTFHCAFMLIFSLAGRLAQSSVQQLTEDCEKPTKALRQNNGRNGANGFVIFGKQHRSALKEQNPTMTFGQMSKALGMKTPSANGELHWINCVLFVLCLLNGMHRVTY